MEVRFGKVIRIGYALESIVLGGAKSALLKPVIRQLDWTGAYGNTEES